MSESRPRNICTCMMQSRPSVKLLNITIQLSAGLKISSCLQQKLNTSPVCPQEVCKISSHPQNGHVRKILVQSASHRPVRIIDTAVHSTLNLVCYVHHFWCGKRGVTNCCQISYTPTEILFEINKITRFSKSEIKKVGMEASKIL